MKLKELLKEGITLKGTVPLYHYTKEDKGQSFTLDPSEKKKSYYSKNDYILSKFPRVFYYTNLYKTEKFVVSPFLYKGIVDGTQILFLQTAIDEWRKNPEELKEKNKGAWEVVQAFLGKGIADWDGMFKTANKYFLGLFYETGNIPMVNLFKPLKVTKYVK